MQGTLYPDVIEIVRRRRGGPSATIKTHHNVGGLPKDMKFALIEPLRELFKDEVRNVGSRARSARGDGWPSSVSRARASPFASLARSRRTALDVLRQADAIYLEEIRAAGLYRRHLAGVRGAAAGASVGVMGD